MLNPEISPRIVRKPLDVHRPPVVGAATGAAMNITIPERQPPNFIPETSSVYQPPKIVAAMAGGTKLTTSKRQLPCAAYTVVWITVLLEEHSAALSQLEEEHLPPEPPDSLFNYDAGTINGHNIVIVRTRGAGPNKAQECADDVRHGFPNIEFGLLVGVAGGLPSGPDRDIRLGDVVVSRPEKGHGGVAAYDGMKLETEGVRYLRHLASPPRHVLSAVNYMETHLEHDREKFDEALALMRDKLPKYGSKAGLEDVLYLPNDADAIDTSRKPRASDDGPHIHYGLIASGPLVIKTSRKSRDEILQRLEIVGGDALCFEMEACGVMDTFPFLVIRGISDYCDIHKNNSWQPYAASAAACYAKCLLQSLRLSKRSREVQDDYTVGNKSNAGSSRQAHGPEGKSLGPCVPPPRSGSPLFLGRAAELATIGRQLCVTNTSEHVMQGEPKILVIQGLGGSGKSELCLRYLKMHERSYWATFWVDGSTDKSLVSGFERIATQLGLASDEDVAGIQHNLATREKDWLLVIDNADDPDLDLAPYLPDQGRGHVLITTRNPELDIFQTEPTLHLGSLAERDSLALFFKAAGTPAQEHASLTSSAKEIMKTLDFHTLAIIQAGAHIRKTRDLNGYVRIFHDQRKRVLAYCAPQARAQYGSVYATFEVSALRLREDADERLQQSAADALELLRLFAFMDRRGPFERIFSDAKEFAVECSIPVESSSDADDAANLEDHDSLGRKYSSLLTPLAYAANDADGKYRWREACYKLHQYSMLSFEKDENNDEVLVFHPLILAWALARQSKDEHRHTWLSIATTIFLSSRGFREHGPILSRLVNHARTCAGHVSKDWWIDTSNLPFVGLLHRMAWILSISQEDAANDRICECLEIALEKIEESFGSPVTRGNIQHILGLQAQRKGEIGKAIQLLERVVKMQEQTLAVTDPNRLSSQHTLAGAYLSNGQIKEAVYLLEHVVKMEKQTLAEADPARLASQNELAGAYLSKNQTRKAVRLLEHVVKIKGRTLAETHPKRLISEHELARAYSLNGQIEEGIRLLEHVVQVEEQTLAETHPHRLISEHELARAYLSNGQTAEAVRRLQRVVQIETQTMAETHLDRLTSEHELALAYFQSDGRDQEAIRLLEHVVEVEQRTLPESHPSRLAAEHELGHAYFQSEGRSQKAIDLLEHVVKVEKQTLSKSDPDRLVSERLLRRIKQSPKRRR